MQPCSMYFRALSCRVGIISISTSHFLSRKKPIRIKYIASGHSALGLNRLQVKSMEGKKFSLYEVLDK